MASTNHQIWMDQSTVTEKIITNILKMLAYRGWIDGDEDNIKKMYSDLLKSSKEKIFNIKLKKTLTSIDVYEPFEKK
jgi:hypothetical protein